MKKILTSFAVILSTAILFTSCKKENMEKNKVTNISLDVTLNAGELYSLDLSKYGDADDIATITTQANNFVTSEIAKTTVIGNYVFMKGGTPKTGGNGNETVVLKISEANRGNATQNNDNKHGGHCNKDETNITIHFTVL